MAWTRIFGGKKYRETWYKKKLKLKKIKRRKDRKLKEFK